MNRDETAAESFERALAAFAGIAVGEPHAADRKMFSIVATARGAHTRITAGGFSVLWPHRRTPFTYGHYLAPRVVSTLRLHAPSHSFAKPFEIDEATLARLGFFRGGARWFWVARSIDAIVMDCRLATMGSTPPTIPDPLPPWTPAEKVFLRFEQPRPCGHCSVAPERYRLIDDVLVCLSCGRSEQVPGLELERATLEHAAVAP
ncbi:hypothetical protein [Polyangium fumosum]|uniref:Uncharacterized protein n=1 Tax=Polyangium fumosum TaxID=889272 RepID=A0A4U1IGZ9_9BACT|nr:hypothetical protein [Polyangium fumosum]TKC93058.1 hypothetical protein E8A74_49885 [Polyangium fumosum]